MRRPFAVLTILAAAAALVFGALRREPLYFARMSAADLAGGKLPRAYLASSIDEVNLAPGVERFMEAARESADATERLAAIEMLAAGLLSPGIDPALVTYEYERLSSDYPDSALVRYRYGAYLLSRLQIMLAEKGVATADQADLEAKDLAFRARMELQAAAGLDPQNSLLYFETAYSYWATGDSLEARAWLERALAAPVFDPGDDIITSACARLVMAAGAPALEALVSTYHVAQVAPSFLAGRMERMTAGFLSQQMRTEHAPTHEEYLDFLATIEDLSIKLFHSARVLRQTQASLVTAGILWRRVAAEATQEKDDALAAEARTQLARASYRYLLVGAERGAAGLAPQQGIIELDIPIDLRLPFSAAAQRLAGVLLMFVAVLAVPLAATCLVALKITDARQLAVSLAVLAVFSALGYVATFYSTVGERTRTAYGLSARLAVILTAPEAVRAAGDLRVAGDFDVDLAIRMLEVHDYTMQAARVLAYIGTQECYDAMIAALDRSEDLRINEVIAVLREETGNDFGYDARSPHSENNEALMKWKEWWDSQRAYYPATIAARPY